MAKRMSNLTLIFYIYINCMLILIYCLNFIESFGHYNLSTVRFSLYSSLENVMVLQDTQSILN